MALTSLVLSFLILSGCTIFKPEDRSDPPLSMPSSYSLYTPGDQGPDQWWEAFASPELNALVTEALTTNFDLRTALARVEQAGATARKSGASLFPTLDSSTGFETSSIQSKTAGQKSIHTDDQDYSLGLAAAYEVDLWGRLRAQKQADHLELAAARDDLEAAAMTVSAEVTSAWIDILAARRKIAILKEQVKNNQTLLELQELRFVNGQASALEVSQQREALAKAKANLPLLQLSETQGLNSLALLLGKTSPEGLSVKEIQLPDPIPVPKTGLPADLLAKRPDVRAAGLRLRSADWEVSAARADRLPALSLSASAAYSHGHLDLLFQNWITTLAASLTSPLFDAGQRAAEVQRTRAVAEELLASYAQTVATAVKEVEDSLAAESRQGEYIGLLEEQLKAARTTLENAQIQYANGQANYLDYLTSWTDVQSLERQLVEEQASLIKYRVTLYQTLGGDWTGKMAIWPTPGKKTESRPGSDAEKYRSNLKSNA